MSGRPRWATRLSTLGTTVCLAAGLAAQAPASADYCRVHSDGTEVLATRPAPDEAPIDDVNWFARPVPNPEGRWIVGFATHDQNYLYDLTRGRRVKIPDSSSVVRPGS